MQQLQENSERLTGCKVRAEATCPASKAFVLQLLHGRPPSTLHGTHCRHLQRHTQARDVTIAIRTACCHIKGKLIIGMT